MLSLEYCRKKLGDAGTNLTDKQIEEIRSILYGFSQIIISDLIKDRKLNHKNKNNYEKWTVL